MRVLQQPAIAEQSYVLMDAEFERAAARLIDRETFREGLGQQRDHGARSLVVTLAHGSGLRACSLPTPSSFRSMILIAAR